MQVSPEDRAVDQMFSDAFEQLVSEQCDRASLRGFEAGNSVAELWARLEESGFVDALVSAERGGSGLSLREVAGLMLACGRYALPVPLPQTMLARARLAEANVRPPGGPITLADRSRIEADGSVRATGVPFALTSDWVWLDLGEADWLLPMSEAKRERRGGHGSFAADLSWAPRPARAACVRLDEPATRSAQPKWVRYAGAAATAALLAGAMEQVAGMSIGYANERVQFGKPIGKFQAIQQQLSVLSEQFYAARTAALIGLSAPDHRVDPYRAAAAKSRASEAAGIVAGIGHAVHGAMGITEEYDLQLYTRRLYEWRCEYGSETYWNGVLGEALLRDTEAPLEFVRQRIAPLP